MKYKTIITAETITAQIDNLLINCFNLLFVDKKPGKIKASTAKRNIADII